MARLVLLAVATAAACTRAAPDAAREAERDQHVGTMDTFARPAPGSAGNPLLRVIRDTLAARNPRLNQFAVLDLSIVSPWRGEGYVAIGYGHCDTCPYQNQVANDELFGVFAVNDSLTRIWHTFDVIQTQAGRDWILRFTRVTGTGIGVRGHSVDYGPVKDLLEKSYDWPTDSAYSRP